MLKGSKYLVASNVIIKRINDIKTKSNKQKVNDQTEQDQKEKEQDVKLTQIGCVDSDNDDNIVCE